MDVNNFSKMRFQPSVNYARAGLNARYQMNAYNSAMMRTGSVFNCGGPAVQSFSYSEGPSNSYLAGNVIGRCFSLVKDNWSSISNFATGAFNTIKGWFS